jgi:hypothetical protein
LTFDERVAATDVADLQWLAINDDQLLAADVESETTPSPMAIADRPSHESETRSRLQNYELLLASAASFLVSAAIFGRLCDGLGPLLGGLGATT